MHGGRNRFRQREESWRKSAPVDGALLSLVGIYHIGYGIDARTVYAKAPADAETQGLFDPVRLMMFNVGISQKKAEDSVPFLY